MEAKQGYGRLVYARLLICLLALVKRVLISQSELHKVGMTCVCVKKKL